jgi:hypothetical protein
VAVGVTLGPSSDGEPGPPKVVPEDVVEDSEEELEVAPEPVPEVVRKEAPAEGAMIAVVLTSFGFSPIRGGDAAPEASVVLPLLDSVGRKISQLEEAVGNHLEEEGRTLAQAVADHVLMCFQSRDPSISLEPAVQGSVEGSTEATRDNVEDDARAVAERFEREPEDA